MYVTKQVHSQTCKHILGKELSYHSSIKQIIIYNDGFINLILYKEPFAHLWAIIFVLKKFY